MSATCNPDGGCNAGCCNPVVLAMTQREVQSMLPSDPMFGDGDRDWMLHDLTPISRREGLDRSPHLHGGVTMGIIRGVPSVVASVFYECRWFDKATRRCTNYDGRPDACRGFPWYGDPPDPAKAIPLHCSYVEDVPVELRHRRDDEITAYVDTP